MKDDLLLSVLLERKLEGVKMKHITGSLCAITVLKIPKISAVNEVCFNY